MNFINDFWHIAIMFILGGLLVIEYKAKDFMCFLFGVLTIIGAVIQIMDICNLNFVQQTIFYWVDGCLLGLYIVISIYICIRFVMNRIRR